MAHVVATALANVSCFGETWGVKICAGFQRFRVWILVVLYQMNNEKLGPLLFRLYRG